MTLSTSSPQTKQIINPQLEQNLIQGTSLNAKEHICTTDENNIPTKNGHTRAEMRLQNLWHRATYIIILHESEDNDDDNEYILIQRRSKLKDYCPGKLDPTPGGVVGYNESYKENVLREIEEEMGISILENNKDGNTYKRLFTFKYVDNIVKCWGDLWEVTYRGSMNDLTLQECEVEEVLRYSIPELKALMTSNPSDFMPDGLYALQLYFQHKHDIKVKRKLIRGYSSTDYNNYNIRPKIQAIFFDCDDCLYFDNWNVANKLTAKIEDWCVNHGLKPGEAYELYKKYGTALKGLLAEGYLDNCEVSIDGYLRDVHDLPIHSLLQRDDELRDMILKIDDSIPKYIFTASVRHHAERCLKALGIDDLFLDIIDVKACGLATKHSVDAFECAMRIANVTDPECCILIDDSLSNIGAAREMGWRSVLVGRIGRDCGKIISSEYAEFEIGRIHDLPKVYPEWFVQGDGVES